MLRDHWYVACPTSGLGAAPIGVRLLDEPVVVFRDRQGAAHALADRCPHLGAALSLGLVDGDEVVCAYHGRRIGPDGECRAPDAASPAPARRRGCRAAAYPCVERDGYVWVWVGDAAPAAPPAIPGFGAHKWLQGTSRVNCNYLRALDNTFDESHVYYAHPGHDSALAMRAYGLQPRQAEVQITEGGCLVFSPAEGPPGGAVPAYAKRVEFTLPATVRFEIPYPFAFVVHFHIIPETARRTRIEWLLKNLDDHAKPLTWCASNPVVDEDRAILESVEATYESEGEAFERSAECDSIHLLMRRIVRLAEAGQWPANKDRLRWRRRVTLMVPTAFI